MDDLHADGRQTLLDVGIAHPLIDTRITKKATVERGFAANVYGKRKNHVSHLTGWVATAGR